MSAIQSGHFEGVRFDGLAFSSRNHGAHRVLGGMEELGGSHPIFIKH
jgi:hypothetical protein